MDEKDLNGKKEPNERVVNMVIAIVRLVFVGILSAAVCLPLILGYILFNEITNDGFEKFAVINLKVYAAIYFVVYFILYWKLIVNNVRINKDGG